MLAAASAAAPASAAAAKRSPAHAAHKAPAHGVLPWVEDDYAKALSAAKAKDVPIFVEIWAPW